MSMNDIPQQAGLRRAALALETQFLARMLRHAGANAPREAFGGGAGESQFASFLAEAQAGAIVEAGGIGLAERIFDSLVARNDAVAKDGADG